MRLAIIGSRSYANIDRITSVIQKYAQRYSDLTIVSGGCPTGGDALAKKIALNSNIPYQEFPPIHAKHNEFCVLSSDNYGKKYNVSNFFTRNTQIAEYCDDLAAFVIKGIKANGTMDTFNKTAKLGKRVFLFEDADGNCWI